MSIPAQPIVTASQLGLALQSTRKSRKLSQAQLASRLGLSQNRLSELEREPGTLSVDQLLALCGQLGLQVVLQRRDDPAAPAASGAGADW